MNYDAEATIRDIPNNRRKHARAQILKSMGDLCKAKSGQKHFLMCVDIITNDYGKKYKETKYIHV